MKAPSTEWGDMKKKFLFCICSAIIIVANIVMATVINNGEEIVSNLFAIGITVLLFPGFLWAINNEKTSLIRAESSALLMMAVISAMRLINRIDKLPPVVNSTALIAAMGLGVLLVVVATIRVFKK